MTERDDLEHRLRIVIDTICNTVGCAKCDLKWEGGCQASYLQDKLFDLDMKEDE